MTLKGDIIKQLKLKGILLKPAKRTVHFLQSLLDTANQEQEKPKAKRPEEDEQKVLPEATYIVSFTLVLNHKEHGYITKHVTESNYHGSGTEQYIIDDVCEAYIRSQYHDSQIEKVSVQHPKVVLRPALQLRDVPAKQVGLQYKMFPADLVVNKNEGECVLDSIMYFMLPAFPCYTRERLIEELTEVAEPQELNFVKDGVCCRHIIAWTKTKTKITCVVLNPLGNVLESVVASDRTAVMIIGLMTNGHFFPIIDKELKLHIASHKKLDFFPQKYNAGTEDWAYCTEEKALQSIELPEMKEKIIHVEASDLSALLKAAIQKTGFVAVGILSHGAFITTFQHPTTGQIFIASQDFLSRKEMADTLFAETDNYIGFLWANQSFAMLGNTWMEFKLGKLPASTYSPDSLMIRDCYPQNAFIGMTRKVTDEEEKQVVSFDICKCYPTALMENTAPFAINSSFDDIEPFTFVDSIPVGKACVNETIHLGKAQYPRGFYPSHFIEYCLKENAIKPENVTHIQRASYTLPADHFKGPTEELLKRFPLTGKKAINPMIGSWGQRSHRSGSVAITDSWETAVGTINSDKSVQLHEMGNGFWFMRKEMKEELLTGHVALREHIVCMGHIMLHQMEKKVCGPETEVIAYNTDSIKVINPSPSFIATPKTLAKPGEICVEKTNLRGKIISEMKQWTLYQKEGIEFTKLTKLEALMKPQSFMATGSPGCGKSYLLKQLDDIMIKAGLKTVKLCWTKMAANNIDGITFDHFFSSHGTRRDWIAKALKQDAMLCDEFTIIPEFWWNVLLEIKRKKPEMIFCIFGGPNQLHSETYESNADLWFEYHKSALMHYLVDGQTIPLAYIVECGRYDADLKEKLDSFEETKMLQAFGPKKQFNATECEFTIVKTPNMRTKVNNAWVLKLAPADCEVIGKGKTALRIWKGMYLISYKNEGVIHNSIRYQVKDIGGGVVTLISQNNQKEYTATYANIGRVMRYGYADTVMRVISRTIVGKFNIMETMDMNWNEMFVCLSRATCAADIGMGYLAAKKYEYSIPPEKGQVKKIEHKLFKGEIYSRTDGEYTYIGSSNDATRREKEHDRDAVSKKVAAWNVLSKEKIIQKTIETFLCLTEQQLVKREYFHIALIPKEKCMNTCGVAMEKTTSKFDAPIEVQFTRFKIKDDVKGKRYRIRWNDNDSNENTKDISYKNRPKAECLKEAEEFRAALVKQYYI